VVCWGTFGIGDCLAASGAWLGSPGAGCGPTRNQGDGGDREETLEFCRWPGTIPMSVPHPAFATPSTALPLRGWYGQSALHP
jgi:hypothetical protein